MRQIISLASSYEPVVYPTDLRLKRSTRDFCRPFHLDLPINASSSGAGNRDGRTRSGQPMAITDRQHQQSPRRQLSAAATARRKAAATATATAAVARIARARYRSNLRLSPSIVHGAVRRGLEI